MKITLLQNYQNTLEQSLEKLKTSSTPLSKQEVIEILLIRDAIHKALSNKIKPSANAILKIEVLDIKLRENAEKLIQDINLAEYRENFPKTPNAWWWYLDNYVEEKAKKFHPWNRFDWLVRVIRVIVWTGNLALLGTLASLFLSSASGLGGAVTIAIPSILSLLQAQSELTETGKKGFDKVLDKVKIPQHFHEEAKLVYSLLMTGLLLVIWLNLPFFSNRYKLAGKKLQEQEKLASAEEKYLQAIKLDSENLDAHYKLATLYEELQDFSNAKKQYIIAAKGGFLDAYNNLAYWYIRENKNGEGIDLLRQGLQLLEEKEKNFEQLTDKEKLNLQTQKYNIYKNIGWVRFKQKRYDDSVAYLLPAMAIAKNSKYQQYIRNPGTAFCIYTQILSRTNKPSSKVKENWQQCRQLIESRLAAGETINSEEDEWLYEAKQQLKINN
ncbi:MAG: tetratricopeptide repeat protein [Okeania sp. SIO2C9]|uniref:tetratricopeptide repeat protein n=1 Tax=Okeania sp. SIO2C9 TaxID=2607791 RepID=UPI0013C11835|nr:tetratricopeptide repeat protein [Okeania sp. SIO2C9]NEQ76941.1 tetratricopeptide repeat protein [Okeania sp. SIO2C9]